jgi:Carboxypeptidase regulatory-like domain
MRRISSAAVLFLLLWVAVFCGYAQTPTGTIQGNVTDPSGAAVPGATVSITNVATNVTKILKTDAAGRYELLLVQPGTYSITIDAAGFRPSKQENVRVDVAQARPVDFALAVGDVTQSVTVNETTAALDTHASAVGSIITAKPIADLPLNGRNPFDFAELVPGVSIVGDSGGPGNGGVTPHIAGSRNASNEESLDGVTNILPENNVGNNISTYQPIVDSVQEFSVQTSVLPAEYGRFSGGVINLVTKSGSNQLHGTFFEFARNAVLDAKDYYSIGPKPAASRNQFGGTFGGPIVIPHIYDGHNKSFFFVALEDSRESDSTTEQDSVPLAAWRNGDFSSLSAPIYDPSTATLGADGNYHRTQFQGNMIPTNRLSSVASAALNYYPLPNAGGPGATLNNYVVTGTTTDDYYHYDIRLDHDFRPNWHSFVRLSHLSVNSTPLNEYNNVAAPNGGNPSTISAYSFSYDNLITISPKLLAEVRYGFSRFSEVSTPFGQGFNPSALGFPGSFSAVSALTTTIFPSFTFSNGYTGLGAPNGYGILLENPSAHQVAASIIKIAGNNTIKVGGEFRKLFLNFHQYGFPSGDFPFDQSWTQGTVANADGSGNPFASMLLGLPNGGQITHDTSSADASGYFALYAQDDIQASNTLTFNVGLRWDAELPRTERYNKLSYWDDSLPSPLQGAVNGSACLSCGNLVGQMVFAGTPQSKYGRRQAPIQWKDFAPRVGFAWSATPKTVVRGGFGLVFAASVLQAAGTSGGEGNDGFQSSTPFNYSFDNERTIYTTLDNPAPNGYNLPLGAAGGASTFLGNSISSTFFNTFRNTYAIQNNLTIQQALPHDTIVEVGYLGNHGLFLPNGDPGVPFSQVNPQYLSLGQHLYDSVPNPFYGLITTAGSPLSQPTIQRDYLLRPFPQYNGVESYRKATAGSNYHALTLKVNKSFSRGFSTLISFTEAKLMDNAASSVTFIGPTSSTYINQYNPKAEYGLSSQDQSHTLVGDVLYELPFGRGKQFLHDQHGVTNTLVSGWQLGALATWGSGTPIVLAAAIEQTGLFTLGQRPTEAPGDPNLSSKSWYHWFNTALFSQPAAFTLGNAPRALPNVRTPETTSSDISAIKNNYIGSSERYSLQFRIEAFNAFNHPILGSPDTNVNDPTTATGGFGVISSQANTSRQVQLAVKFIY